MIITDRKLLGERLKKLRDLLGKRQDEIGTEVNLSRNKVHRCEDGTNNMLEDFLTLLSYYEAKIHPRTFNIFAEEFTIYEHRVPVINQVAQERLTDLNDLVNKEINAIKEQLSFVPQF